MLILLCLDSKSQKTDENNTLVAVINLRLRSLPYFFFLFDKQKILALLKFHTLEKGGNRLCKSKLKLGLHFPRISFSCRGKRTARCSSGGSPPHQAIQTAGGCPHAKQIRHHLGGEVISVQSQQKSCHPSSA